MLSVCLGQRALMGGEEKGGVPLFPALCVSPPPHWASPSLPRAWTEDKDQGGRWPFETTRSQYPVHTPVVRLTPHSPQLRPVSTAQYTIAAVVGDGGVGLRVLQGAALLLPSSTTLMAWILFLKTLIFPFCFI